MRLRTRIERLERWEGPGRVTYRVILPEPSDKVTPWDGTTPAIRVYRDVGFDETQRSHESEATA